MKYNKHHYIKQLYIIYSLYSLLDYNILVIFFFV